MTDGPAPSWNELYDVWPVAADTRLLDLALRLLLAQERGQDERAAKLSREYGTALVRVTRSRDRRGGSVRPSW